MKTNTINKKEIEKFSKIAEEWWDPEGKFKPLHNFNPIRISYIKENIIKSFGLKQDGKILSKIKILDIFKWIKKSGVTDNEMIKTFNCGVGFCIIIKEENLKVIEKYFKKSFKPYVIGKIINGKNRVKLNGKIIWEK